LRLLAPVEGTDVPPPASSPSIFGYRLPTSTSRSSSGYGSGLKKKTLKREDRGVRADRERQHEDRRCRIRRLPCERA